MLSPLRLVKNSYPPCGADSKVAKRGILTNPCLKSKRFSVLSKAAFTFAFYAAQQSRYNLCSIFAFN